MRLPDFMVPSRADTPAFGMVLLASAALLGVFAASGNNDAPRVHPAASDDEYGWDCRVQGDRTCGSDVTWQDPGTYPAPDGGTYRVVLVTPYTACLQAAGIPGPSGFDPGVCEQLKEKR